MPFTIDGTTGFNLPEDANLTVNDGNLTITSPAGSGGRYLKLDNTDTGGRQYAMISTNDSHGSLGGGDFAILDVDLGGNDANQTRFLISSSGNIGIGTAAPSTTNSGYDGGTLHVHNTSTGSSIRLTNSTVGTGTSAGMLFSKWNDTHTYITNFDDGAKTVFTQSNSSGTLVTTMTLDGDGNVGIGTISPTSTLDVRGNIQFGPAGTNYAVGDIVPGTAAVGQVTKFRLYNSNEFQFQTYDGSNYNTAIHVDTGARVGIGETNPENILHIKTSAAGGPQIELDSTSGTANSAFINFDGTSLQLSTQRDMVDGSKRDTAKSWGGINIVGAAAGSYIQLQTSSGNNNAVSTRMTVDKDGNVGIGVTDPTDKLTLTVGNGGGILQSTYYSGTATSGQKLGVIGFKGYSQGNTVAGADAKIEAVAAGNHSGSSAPANLDFYTKPESIGPGSAAILRHRIHEEGHQTIYKGTNNWSVQRHSQSSGCFVCHRLYGAGSSTTTYNLLRYRRHYWGSGSVKFTLSQTYYSGTAEGEYWLTGHGRSDGSYNPSYSIAYVDVYNGPGSGRLSTNMPGGAPGNSDAEIVDVSISIPAYYYYMVRVEVSHSEYYTTTSVMGSVNSFALYT